MKYVIPIFIAAIFIVGGIKKLPIYDLFLKGAKESIDVTLSLFPNILAMCVLVEVMSRSGLVDILTEILSPVMNFLGVSDGLMPLIVFRPFSGSGSIALLENVYNLFGVDSYEGRVASVIAASSETVFYMSAVYFSSVKAKGAWKAIVISLTVGFFGVVLSSLICKIL